MRRSWRWIAVLPIVLFCAGCTSFDPPDFFCKRAESSWNAFATALTLDDPDFSEALEARDVLISDWEGLALRRDTPKDLRPLLGAMSRNVRSAWVATDGNDRANAMRSLRNGLEIVDHRCDQTGREISLRNQDLQVAPPPH